MKHIERIDDVTALEIKKEENGATYLVTLLHRGERIHSCECGEELLEQVIEDHRKIYANEEETK